MSSFDNSVVRTEFPITSRMLYFDSAHQAPLANCVRAALHRFLDESHQYAGPKSIWLNRVERIRERLAIFLGVSSDDVAFTKNTSEGTNIAVNALPWSPGDNVLLLENEHPNCAYPWLHQRARQLDIRLIPEISGCVSEATFAPYTDDRTRAIGLSHVSFSTGQRHDLRRIAEFAAKHKITLVVDAMQSVGFMQVHASQLGASIVSASCHKGLLTPHGVGFFYRSPKLDQLRPCYAAMAGSLHPHSRASVGLVPLELSDTARRFEIGNFNYLALHGLDAALELLEGIGVDAVEEHVLTLGDYLLARMDALGVEVIGSRDRACRSHIYVLGLESAEWLPYFSERQVRCSVVRRGIRLSFAIFNTMEEIDRFAGIVDSKLRRRVRRHHAGSPAASKPSKNCRRDGAR